MSTLPKMILHPRMVTHAVAPPSGIVETQVEGGLPVTRADVLHGASGVPVSWVTKNKQQYDYLMAFYNTKVKEGALPFLVYLCVLSSACDWLECKFVKNSFKLVSTDGVLSSFSAKLRIVDKRDAEKDQYFVDLATATGSVDEEDHLCFLNLFDELVNEVMPEHLGDD